MKLNHGIFVAVLLGLSLVSSPAQPASPMGAMGRGSPIPRSMARLFGENSNFSAEAEVSVKTKESDEPTPMPVALAFSDGKARFEVDMARKLGHSTSGAADQMRGMGLDKMVMISHPDKQLNYMVYPGLDAYVEMPITDSNADKKETEFKVETTELGKEEVDGHPCIKNKSTMTEPDGKKHEALTWNATDLKKFPIKIQQNEQGNDVTVRFSGIKFQKPEASLFEPPKGATRYDSMQAMMQQVIARMGAGQGTGAFPPRPAPLPK